MTHSMYPEEVSTRFCTKPVRGQLKPGDEYPRGVNPTADKSNTFSKCNHMDCN